MAIEPDKTALVAFCAAAFWPEISGATIRRCLNSYLPRPDGMAGKPKTIPALILGATRKLSGIWAKTWPTVPEATTRTDHHCDIK